MQWLAFGDFEQAAARVKHAGIPLVIMIRSVDEARKAAALGADIVVAQVPISNCFAALTSWISLHYAGMMTTTTLKKHCLFSTACQVQSLETIDVRSALHAGK